MEAILAVDCGTTGLKVTLVGRDGSTLATCSHEYRNVTHTASGGVVEQHPDDWWFAMKECVKELLSQDAELESSICAISLSGQMQDVIFACQDGTALGPAILYSDSRAEDEAHAIEAQVENLKCQLLESSARLMPSSPLVGRMSQPFYPRSERTPSLTVGVLLKSEGHDAV